MTVLPTSPLRRCRALLVVSVVLLCYEPYFAAGPAFADDIRDQQWALSQLRISTAHRYTEGNGVTVAVIDTGVDADHVDLRGNVLAGADFSTGLPRGDGHRDIDGHGTGMAGLIAGHGHGPGNRSGILGIAPDAKILPIRLFGHDGGAGGAMGAAVRWSVDHGANVVSMSFGAPTSSNQVEAAMSAAENANVVLVAAAGNTYDAPGTQYPAAYPGVVGAGGTSRSGGHSRISVTGSDVLLSAPADDIVSTDRTGGYLIGSGTSNSTAIVAGAAALVRSRFPNLSADEVIHRLTATAIDKGAPGRDDVYGYGLINIVAALTANIPPLSPTGASPGAPAQPSGGVGATTSSSPAVAVQPHETNDTSVIASIAGVGLVIVALGILVLLRRRGRSG